MPLRVRLALLFMLGVALVIAVAGVGFLLQLRMSVDAALDPGLRARLRVVADQAGSTGSTSPPPGDQILQVRALDGRLLTASEAAGDQPLLDAAQWRQAVSGEVSFTTTVAGDRSRLLADTVAARDGRLVVVVGTGTDVSDAAVARVRSALLLGGVPAVLLAGAGAWLLAGAALRPVERMRREAAAISERNAGRRLAVPNTRDEIAALGVTMNGLLDRLQAALERERGFVADAGHELRTPLAVLRAELELAARPGRTAAALAEAVEHAGEETDRLIRLAEDLLLLARADNGQPFLKPERVRLGDMVTAAARGAAARASSRGVEIVVDTPDGLTVEADPDRLRQAVDNLLDNATRHAPRGGRVTVTTTATADTVAVTVGDDGPGFAPDFLPHAFERFHRAEAARTRGSGGTGLGLSIVRAIAEAHGGRATARNRDEGGASLTLELPARAAAGPPRSS